MKWKPNIWQKDIIHPINWIWIYLNVLYARKITSITYLLQQHPVPYVYYVLFQKVSEEILSLHFSIPRRLASYGTNFPTDFVFHESFPIFYNGLLRHSILINVCRISELVEEKGTLFPFFSCFFLLSACFFLLSACFFPVF